MDLKKLLLNLYIWPVFAVFTVFCLCFILPLLLIYSVLANQPMDRVIRKSICLYGWALVRVVPFMAPVTVEDFSNGIKPPVIFVPNHNSSIDPYLFGMLQFENAFVTSWPFQIPVYKWLMRMARYINSNDGWEVVLSRGEELLASGCSLIIWPEGHRSRDGRLARFKNGAFRLACDTATSIVPVCILGSDRLMSPGSRFLTPSRVKIVILPPIIPSGHGDDPDCIRALKDQTRESIATELAKRGVNPFKITGYKSDMMSDPITSSAIRGND
ncbi:MAG: lysophospholipid acyltransferase family protein [Thermodesulfobacteriota bacterium]|nr:lysophospholipid acyltransferase family protein [Thermodesulfobacteriota bacterium]